MVIISNSSRRASTTMEKMKNLGFDPSLFVGAITSGELTYQHLQRLSTIDLKILDKILKWFRNHFQFHFGSLYIIVYLTLCISQQVNEKTEEYNQLLSVVTFCNLIFSVAKFYFHENLGIFFSRNNLIWLDKEDPSNGKVPHWVFVMLVWHRTIKKLQ